MPEMDGLESTRRQRRREQEERKRPVIIAAITANALSESRELCLEAGMDYFLTKPFRLAQVRSLLERVVERRKSAAE